MSNATPKIEIEDIEIDDDAFDDNCPCCGGLGYLDGECICNAIEDTCCCAEPEPPVCATCRGTGSIGGVSP